MVYLHVMSPGSARAELGRTSFDGPVGCDVALLEGALRRFLERPDTERAIPDDVTLRVRARRTGARFVLTLDVRRADGATTHRTVRHATRCDLLLETAALIAALAIDPEVAGRNAAPLDEPGQDPAPPVDEGPTDEHTLDGPPATSPDGPPPRILSEQERADPVVPDPEQGLLAAAAPSVSELDPAPPGPAIALDGGGHHPPGFAVGVGLGPTVALHLLGGHAGGGAMVFALMRGHLRVELRLSAVVFRSVGLGEPGWRMRVVDYAADLAGCYAPSLGAWSIPVCVQLGAGGETASASLAVPNSGRATRGRVSVAERVGVRWSGSPRWQLGVDAEVAEQLVRPVFGVEGTLRLARAHGVGYRTTLSWTAVWP